VIRPVCGLEVELAACLESAFRQTYPRDKFSIRLCVESESDPAYPLLQKLVAQFPDVDGQVLVQEHDAEVHARALGPNRKIRNLSRAYREAKDDVVWILDSNVWVGRNTAGRMVDQLMGMHADGTRPRDGFKLVHQLPLAIDALSVAKPWTMESMWNHGGGRLDEMYLATTHAKFYSAINLVGVPCTVGKSNMFRKSDLDDATACGYNPSGLTGLDYYSPFICEDLLIGQMLSRLKRADVGNHAVLFGDLAIQPMGNLSVQGYISRRVRWLRARKWDVLVATTVEPGIECLVWSAYLIFAVRTLSLFETVIAPTWAGMAGLWCGCMGVWALVDRLVYAMLHSGLSIDVDEHTPAFASGALGSRRGLGEWIVAWLGREVLALPIWIWAYYGPSVVTWRGKKFRIARDMTVVEDKATATVGSR